jgi:hypothetical protein
MSHQPHPILSLSLQPPQGCIIVLKMTLFAANHWIISDCKNGLGGMRRTAVSIDIRPAFLLYKKNSDSVCREKSMFHIADAKEIKEGQMTDVYFLRTMQVLKVKGIDKWVKAEFIARRFPEDQSRGVLAVDWMRVEFGALIPS